MSPPPEQRWTELERRVAVLEARDAIRRQLDRAALAVDTRDEQSMRDVFTADVAFTVFGEGTWQRGWDALWAHQLELVGTAPTLHHAVGSVEVEVEEDAPDLAASRHLGYMWRSADDGLRVAALTYDLTWRRESDGRWRISRLSITPWWSCLAADLIATGWDPAAADGQPSGAPPWLPWCAPTFPGPSGSADPTARGPAAGRLPRPAPEPD